MTNKEQFEAWFKANSTQIIKDYGFGTLSEDVMFSAWQARGKLDAKRIAELEERHKRDSEEYHLMHVALTSANSKLAIAIEALDMLSKLGNGDRVGNSIGNDIAVEALTKIKGE